MEVNGGKLVVYRGGIADVLELGTGSGWGCGYGYGWGYSSGAGDGNLDRGSNGLVELTE